MDVGDESFAEDRLETDGGARDRSVGAGEAPASDVRELARLRARERQLQAVADLGFQALGDREFSTLIDRAVRTVARALEVEIVAIEETQPDGELVVRSAVGLGEATQGREQAGAGEGSQAGYTLSAGAPVVSDDLMSEARFRPSPVLQRNRARSSISVATGPPQAAYGVLLAATTRPRRFSEDDVTFLHAVSNVLAIAWERGKTEEALRVSEELFREGFDHSPIGMGLADLDGTYIRVNAAFARMLGYQRPEDLVGVSTDSVTHPDDLAQNHEAISSMRGEGPWSGEKRFIRTDGEVVHALVGSTLIRERGGRPVFFNQARDITKLRRAQAQLDATRAQLQSVLDHAPALIYLTDVNGRILLINKASEAVLGVPPDQALGKVREDVLPTEAAAAHRANDLEVIKHGQPILFEETSPLPDGEHTYQSIKFPLRDHDGRIYAIGGISSDITEQRHAEHERLEALRASALAESANRAKSEFLARMSHELRTPLNSIIGFSQVLQLERLEPRHSEDLGHILTAGNHLLALVDDVLDIARIESGQMTISPEPVALANTVNDALGLLAPIARERHVSLGIDTDGLAHDGHVHADRNRFKQVLLNVLSNAIKYNRPGGRVDVSFQITDSGRVRTMITDTGLGIAHLDKLFEPFERLGAEQTDVEGTGLGLALSKGLIEAMGGTIEVESTVGVGTTFVIDLEAAQRPAGERQPSPGDQPLHELGGPDAKPQLILYIEDNLSNLTLVERILERRVSVEVISAMQGTIGLELARQHRPDLIVLDLHLPDMPGADVLTRLKTDPITREIPVIVLTADASGRQAERVRQLGAIDYLTKPLDVPKFIETIANNLAEREPGSSS